MRKAGIDVPKRLLAHQREAWGELELLDVRDDGVGRTVRVARLTASAEAKETLFEPHIVWMSGQRFVLAGFERMVASGATVHYAQSWLCSLDREDGVAESTREAERASREAR